jgi:multiple sugar transport system substrate-binding protein
METKKLSRRDFIKLAAVTGGAAVLAACAPGGGSSAGKAAPTLAPLTKDNVEIQIWASDWGKEYNDPMITLTDAFTKDVATNVKGTWTFLPKITDKLSAAVAGGNPPDVALVDDTYAVPKLGKLGGVLELTDYYTRDGIKKEDFIPFTWPTVVNKGKIYGVPGGAGAQCLMINNAVFKDAGIDPSSLPDTPSWDQFVEWNQKLTKKDSSGKLTGVGINATGWNQQYLGILGFEYFNSDATKIACNSQKSVDAFKKWAAMLPEGVPFDDVSKLLSSAPSAPSYAAFGAGIQGMENDGYWCFLVCDKYFKDFDYQIIKLPTPTGKKEEWNQYTGWVWDMVLPKGTKHPSEGWEFIKYGFWSHGEMLADTVNWTSALKCFEPFEKRTMDLIGSTSPTGKGLHHFAESQYGGQYAVPYTSIHSQYTAALGTAYDKAVRGTMSMQDALDEVAKTIQPELDKFNAAG